MTTKTEKLRALERWESAINSTEKYAATLHRSMGLQSEGGLITAFASLEKALTEATAELLKDRSEWLVWYWLDNNMGARGLDAGPRGKTREIRCLEDLLWVIEVKT